MITTIGKVVNCIFINIGEIKLPKKGKKSGYNIQCENCGNTEWQGKLIPLEVHHMDGDRLNNVLENLQLLCPNCHAQTENYRNRNISTEKEKRNIISDEDFVQALQTSKNIRQALLKSGLAAKGGNYARANEIIAKYNIRLGELL